MSKLMVISLLSWLVSGCSGGSWAPAPRGRSGPQSPTSATSPTFSLLSSARGPTRFACVGPRLYRGGQPTVEQIAWLKELGVRTVISLRDEDERVRDAERAAAERLGMRFVSFPFSGTSSPDPSLLRQIVGAMRDTGDGAVYVHCHAGRDRTSLVVALYRVWVDGWAPRDAWAKESTDFGHRGWIWFRGLDRAFTTLTAPPA